MFDSKEWKTIQYLNFEPLKNCSPSKLKGEITLIGFRKVWSSFPSFVEPFVLSFSLNTMFIRPAVTASNSINITNSVWLKKRSRGYWIELIKVSWESLLWHDYWLPGPPSFLFSSFCQNIMYPHFNWFCLLTISQEKTCLLEGRMYFWQAWRCCL